MPSSKGIEGTQRVSPSPAIALRDGVLPAGQRVSGGALPSLAMLTLAASRFNDANLQGHTAPDLEDLLTSRIAPLQRWTQALFTAHAIDAAALTIGAVPVDLDDPRADTQRCFGSAPARKLLVSRQLLACGGARAVIADAELVHDLVHASAAVLYAAHPTLPNQLIVRHSGLRLSPAGERGGIRGRILEEAGPAFAHSEYLRNLGGSVVVQPTALTMTRRPDERDKESAINAIGKVFQVEEIGIRGEAEDLAEAGYDEPCHITYRVLVPTAILRVEALAVPSRTGIEHAALLALGARLFAEEGSAAEQLFGGVLLRAHVTGSAGEIGRVLREKLGHEHGRQALAVLINARLGDPDTTIGAWRHALFAAYITALTATNPPSPEHASELGRLVLLASGVRGRLTKPKDAHRPQD